MVIGTQRMGEDSGTRFDPICRVPVQKSKVDTWAKGEKQRLRRDRAGEIRFEIFTSDVEI